MMRRIGISSQIRFRMGAVRGTHSDRLGGPRGAGRKTGALSSPSPSANLVGKSARGVLRAGGFERATYLTGKRPRFQSPTNVAHCAIFALIASAIGGTS